MGLALTPDDERSLRCLTDVSSGYLLNLGDEEPWEPALVRLAAAIRNVGTLRVDMNIAGLTKSQVQGRIYRAGSAEPVRVIRTGVAEELASGMYRLVLETLPPLTLDRLLVLRAVSAWSARGRRCRSVQSYSPTNEPLSRGGRSFPRTGRVRAILLDGRPVYVQSGR